MELEAAILEKSINDALAKSSHTAPIKVRQAEWWNSDLHILQKEVIKLSFLMIQTSDPDARAEFLAKSNNSNMNAQKLSAKNGRNLAVLFPTQKVGHFLQRF